MGSRARPRPRRPAGRLGALSDSLRAAAPGRRRGRKSQGGSEPVLYVVIVALVLGVLGLGWGYTSRGANMQEVQHHYDSLQREFHNRMNELTVLKVRRRPASPRPAPRRRTPRAWRPCRAAGAPRPG